MRSVCVGFLSPQIRAQLTFGLHTQSELASAMYAGSRSAGQSGPLAMAGKYTVICAA